MEASFKGMQMRRGILQHSRTQWTGIKQDQCHYRRGNSKWMWQKIEIDPLSHYSVVNFVQYLFLPQYASLNKARENITLQTSTSLESAL